MRYVKPHYYDGFKCIADKCPDTCCAGWQIVVDDDTMEKYEAFAFGATSSEDEFALRMQESIDWEEGCFLQHGRRCAMLNDQNLCDLISAKGEGYLCETCNRYPRHVEEFEGLREYSLSLSCPVVADMMLKMTEQTRFLVEEDDLPDPLEEEFEDFDFMLFTQLEDAREVIFDILRNRKLSMTERMAILMDMARDMQDCLDEDRLFDLQDVIEVYGKRLTKLSQAESCQGECTRALMPVILEGEDRYWQLKESFEIYTKLERLREEWTEVLEGTYEELYAGGYKEYEVIYKEFCEAVTDKWQAQQDQQTWEVFLEQILTFFLYTYFCGAVYDDCIYSKVAMSVMSTCYIREFIMYTWLTQGKKVSLDECIRVAYRYAREIEHSDLNLNDLEQWLMDRR
ncbi:MAG: flagellin lysine-N-methylase [Lachnospiraceae bacterium]|nr:flagellin lysine-N-methylase [Lachnospiraceae bacterium]